MVLTGILRSWDDDRGFGFIAPTQGGRELFVHISAFARDGSRPTVGETVSYELGQGKDGKPQARRVWRQALGAASTQPQIQPQAPLRRASASRVPAHRGPGFPLGRLLLAVLLLSACAWAYKRYAQHVERLPFFTSPSELTEPHAEPSLPATAPTPAPSSFRCDGRLHCSQMTSCAEATYFLKNCPGTEMDGDHDGVPCEQQWCTGPFSR